MRREERSVTHRKLFAPPVHAERYAAVRRAAQAEAVQQSTELGLDVLRRGAGV